MTIGMAVTGLYEDKASFLLVADTRYSQTTDGDSNGVVIDTADMAVKTYSLGRQVGAVSAGSALSVSSAADLTRGIADDHDLLEPDKPINFYSTVRLFAYFLAQAERANPWSTGCEVALAGFFANGVPGVARVFTRPAHKTLVDVYAPRRSGSLILMVGKKNAKSMISSAMSHAFAADPNTWLDRAVATVAYLCEHEGESSIGGAPAVAVCHRGERIYWPFVVLDGRTYLRGFDVSQSGSYPPGPGCLHLTYDQNWHANADQERLVPELKSDEGFVAITNYAEDWLAPQEVFSWKLDPDIFRQTPDLASPPHVIRLMRDYELDDSR